MIGQANTNENENDCVASGEILPHAGGVMIGIEETVRPEIGLEKENKRCTGVAGRKPRRLRGIKHHLMKDGNK